MRQDGYSSAKSTTCIVFNIVICIGACMIQLTLHTHDFCNNFLFLILFSCRKSKENFFRRNEISFEYF